MWWLMDMELQLRKLREGFIKRLSPNGANEQKGTNLLRSGQVKPLWTRLERQALHWHPL